MIKHFLSLSSFNNSQILHLLKRANDFSSLSNPIQFNQILKNKFIASVFYEPSTRTRCSFEIAAKKLGAEVIQFTPENSSVKKGETLYDTLKTLESLGVDAIILRHSDDKIFDELTTKFKIPLINAGAGRFEHPSQGLLDLFTLQQEFNQLNNLVIGICGDIKHSRVAGSMMVAAEKFDIEVNICGPTDLIPRNQKNVYIYDSLNEMIPKLDALMLLRIQLERHQSLELNQDEYFKNYGLDKQRLNLMKPQSIFLHPGPFNRNVEIADDIVEHPKSRIFKQMSNGVYTRMSILEYVLGD